MEEISIAGNSLQGRINKTVIHINNKEFQKSTKQYNEKFQKLEIFR